MALWQSLCTAHGDHMDDCFTLYTWISKNISSEKKQKVIFLIIKKIFFFKFFTVFLNT